MTEERLTKSSPTAARKRAVPDGQHDWDWRNNAQRLRAEMPQEYRPACSTLAAAPPDRPRPARDARARCRLPRAPRRPAYRIRTSAQQFASASGDGCLGQRRGLCIELRRYRFDERGVGRHKDGCRQRIASAWDRRSAAPSAGWRIVGDDQHLAGIGHHVDAHIPEYLPLGQRHDITRADDFVHLGIVAVPHIAPIACAPLPGIPCLPGDAGAARRAPIAAVRPGRGTV